MEKDTEATADVEQTSAPVARTSDPQFVAYIAATMFPSFGHVKTAVQTARALIAEVEATS